MENKKRRNIIIITAALSAAAVILLVVIGIAARNREYEPSSWVLRAYGSNVALYNGESLTTVYGGIALNDLPPEDIEILKTGIAFPTRKEAEQAIEDYDG